MVIGIPVYVGRKVRPQGGRQGPEERSQGFDLQELVGEKQENSLENLRENSERTHWRT